MIKRSVGKWFSHYKHNENAKINLFCFVFAGGSPTFFSSWKNVFSDEINVLQNIGKFFNEVSARIFVRVLHLQKGQCIHPLSSTQNSSVFCISFAPSFLLFSVIFLPAIPIKSTQLIDIILCFFHRHIVNHYFKDTRVKSTGNNV